ncbi:MAG: ribosome hibernation-promoting factor, HPF/YfiA family [Candidatus Competibacterales bacterium]
MQINLTGHHVDITDALRSYVHEKLARVERHSDQVTQVHVILTVEKDRQRAEVEIHVAGQDLFADAEEGDMYAAIDGVMHKIDRQIVKHKEKLKAHR